MFYLVTGGSGSGKSEYAEKLVTDSGFRERIYVATMEACGEEGRKRVERHRRLREGKGFFTKECPRGLDGITFEPVFRRDSQDPSRDKASGVFIASEAAEAGSLMEDRKAGACSRAVLVECISNLAANELFGAGGEEADAACGTAQSASAALARMKKGILSLREQCRLLVVVTNEVFSDGIDYGRETKEYIRLLGEMNGWMAREADRVVEVVYGIPVEVK